MKHVYINLLGIVVFILGVVGAFKSPDASVLFLMGLVMAFGMGLSLSEEYVEKRID